MKALLTVFFSLCLLLPAGAALKVISLHPLVGEIARKVGGEKVQVVDLLQPGANVHGFEPNIADVAKSGDAALLLASGKGLEPFLPKLVDSIGKNCLIVEVGRTIPSVKVDAKQKMFVCCPQHAQGGIDPHWWHSPKNMQLGCEVVARSLKQLDAANAAYYDANLKQAKAHYQQLDGWAKQQIARIDKSRRILVTAHAAFSYLCRDYGMRSIPMQGLSKEDDGSPQYLAETIEQVKKLGVPAVFADVGANPKVLTELTRGTGARMGKPLLADGPDKQHASFEAMWRYNINSIVDALGQ